MTTQKWSYQLNGGSENLLKKQTCSESQKFKSSQSHDFDFKFLPKNLILKIKIERLKIFRIVKLVVL